MSKVKVAVYGSLLSGLGNHRVMQMAEGELVGRGTVEGFDLWDYCRGAYPAVSENPDASLLEVEVYEVPLNGLEGPLDRLEGYPSFYNRKQVDVLMETEAENSVTIETDVWIYYHTTEPTNCDLIPSGDWKEYKTRR